MGYRYSSKLLDYENLANWALDRKGEIIFCEGYLGDYLPFKPLINLKGIAGKVSKEVIFYKTSANVSKQLSLVEAWNI